MSSRYFPLDDEVDISKWSMQRKMLVKRKEGKKIPEYLR